MTPNDPLRTIYAVSAVASTAALILAPFEWRWPIIAGEAMFTAFVGAWEAQRRQKRRHAVNAIAVYNAVSGRHLSAAEGAALLAGDVAVEEVPAGLRAGVAQ